MKLLAGHWWAFSAVASLALLLSVPVALATEHPGTVPEDAAIIERLNEPVDLSLVFAREDGTPVTLKELMVENRPLVIAPVYFTCPRLCTLTQNGLLTAIKQSGLKLGEDFTAVSVSFSDRDTAAEATAKANEFRGKLGPEQGDPTGWSFLTGKSEQVSALLTQLGFNVREDGTEFIHAAVLVVLMPDGRISRYLYGIDYPEKDFRLALVEASRGRIGSTLDRVLLFCFRFDHTAGKYTLAIWNITRIICGGFFCGLFVMLVRFRLSESRARKAGDGETLEGSHV